MCQFIRSPHVSLLEGGVSGCGVGGLLGGRRVGPQVGALPWAPWVSPGPAALGPRTFLTAAPCPFQDGCSR